MKEFRSQLEDLMPTEELFFDATSGFGSVYKRFLNHSIAHPAKMNTHLTEFLIERFTEKGDLVLDPMAGSGQTGVISALHGRDAVCVDIEDKFFKWMEKARRKVESQQTLVAKGKIRNICGDARNLSSILKEADVVVTSPPYARDKGGEKGMLVHDEKRKNDATLYRTYTAKEENIDNLPFGCVDAVISSPPYANLPVISYDNTEWTKYFQKQLKEKGYIEWQGKRYTEEGWRAINHGRIDGRTAKGMKKGDVGYSQVDVVVTSPPYAESAQESDKSPCITKPPRKGDVRQSSRKAPINKYSQSKENIGNLRFVDTVITSPPFETTVPFQDKEWIIKHTVELTEKFRKAHPNYKNPPGNKKPSNYHKNILESYSSNTSNIGNLKKETYLSAMLKVYVEMFKVLKPNGKAIIVIKPFIRNKKVVDLPLHTWLLLKKAGFKLAKLFKLRLKTQSFWRILYHKKYPKVPQIQHEYILVCKKLLDYT